MKTTLENYEERFVDYMEGQLDSPEMREVELFVSQHPELKEDFKIFGISKLKPNTDIVFTKKEQLIPSSKRIVMPLFVKWVSAAAAIALLVGVGIRFFHHEERLPQSMTATLKPLEAQPIVLAQEASLLRKSKMKTSPIPSQKPERPPLEEITPLAAIQKPLDQGVTVEYSNLENLIINELELRMAVLEPFGEPEEGVEYHQISKGEQVLASLYDYFFGSARKITKTIYKRTAKTGMTAYYTADDYLQTARRKDE